MLDIHIKRTLGPHQAGQIVRVESDANGVPMDQYWRRRLIDAQHDDCCEVVKPEPAPKRRASSKED